MELVKTHGTALLHQALTRPAGGCPSGPGPEDLMRGGHEGANPHAGQRVAYGLNDDSSTTTAPIYLTRLDMLNIFLEKANSYGPKIRPLHIDIEERTDIVFNSLYPNVPLDINIHRSYFKETITKILSNCEKRYNECKRNFQYFCKKNKTWLDTVFDIKGPSIEIQNPLSIQEQVLQQQE
jgi:hypothetical protein